MAIRACLDITAIAVIRNEFEEGFFPIGILRDTVTGKNRLARHRELRNNALYQRRSKISSFRAYRKRSNLAWPAGAAEAVTSRYKPDSEELLDVWNDLRVMTIRKTSANDRRLFRRGTYDTQLRSVRV